MLRPLVASDVERVVDVHLRSFRGFFLTSLGRRFLTLYYAGVVRSPDHIGFAFLDDESRLQGFVAGSSNPRGFYSRLLKRDGIRFAFAALGAIVRSPAMVLRVARAVRHPARNPAGDEVAGLFSIGVNPGIQGSGAGRRLVEAFVTEAAARGCRRVCLTTDRDGNDAVNEFYRGLGFAVGRRFTTPEGRRMNEYWKDLEDPPTGN